MELAAHYTTEEIRELTRWLLEKLGQIPAHRLLWADEVGGRTGARRGGGFRARSGPTATGT